MDQMAYTGFYTAYIDYTTIQVIGSNGLYRFLYSLYILYSYTGYTDQMAYTGFYTAYIDYTAIQVIRIKWLIQVPIQLI